jgi:hypothetical protein
MYTIFAQNLASGNVFSLKTNKLYYAGQAIVFGLPESYIIYEIKAVENKLCNNSQ